MMTTNKRKKKIDMRDYIPEFQYLEDDDLIEWYKVFNKYIDEYHRVNQESTDEVEYKLLTDCGIEQFPDWTIYTITNKIKKEED